MGGRIRGGGISTLGGITGKNPNQPYNRIPIDPVQVAKNAALRAKKKKAKKSSAK